MFYGAIVKPGKPTVFVPPPEEHALHLSQAALPATVKEGTRVSLLAKVGTEEPVILCTLNAGRNDTVPLDQFFSEYTELTVDGKADVHISGYYSPQLGEEGGHDLLGEGEDDEDYPMLPRDMVQLEEDESEDESEDDDDSSDEDEDYDLMKPPGRSPSVIIEDITDQDKAAPTANGLRALPAPETKAVASVAVAKKINTKEAAQDLSEDEEEDEDEDEYEDESEEESEEEEVQPEKVGSKRKGPEAELPASKKQQTIKQQQQQAQAQKQQKELEKQQQKEAEKQQKEAKQQKKEKQEKQQAAAAAQKDAGTPGKAGLVAGTKKGVRRFENGFEIHDLQMGDPHGKLARGGKKVEVRYVGKLANGKIFDQTKGRSTFKFRLGVGEVIKGWDKGVEGMRVGDKRKLVVPPVMGYGSSRTGPIPPNSTLHFDVELVDVK